MSTWLHWTLREELKAIPLKFFQELEDERTLNSFYEACITPTPKPDIRYHKETTTNNDFEYRCTKTQQNTSD